MTTAESFHTESNSARAAQSPCYYRCGRRATVVTASRGVCSSCYSRIRNAAANRRGARPIDRRG